MARPQRRQNQPAAQQAPQQDNHLIAQHSSFEGPIPPPALLQGYEDILPGAAERILSMAEEQSKHRIEQEKQVLAANQDISLTQVKTNQSQVRWVGVSDLIGQIFGLIVSLSCVFGGIWLVYVGHEWAGTALFSIPIAGVIRAFRQKK